MAERESRLPRAERPGLSSNSSNASSVPQTTTTNSSGGLFAKLFPSRASASRQSSSDHVPSQGNPAKRERVMSPSGLGSRGAAHEQSALKEAIEGSIGGVKDGGSLLGESFASETPAQLSITELVQALKSPALKGGSLELHPPSDKVTAVLQLVDGIINSYDDARRYDAWQSYLELEPLEGIESMPIDLELAGDVTDRLELLDIARSLIDPFDPFSLTAPTSSSRSAGFGLVLQALTLPSAMPWRLETYKPFSLDTLRSLMKLILISAPDTTPSELSLRVSCLSVITKGGKDISLGLSEGLLPKIIAWITSLGRERIALEDVLAEGYTPRRRLDSSSSLTGSGRRAGATSSSSDAPATGQVVGDKSSSSARTQLPFIATPHRDPPAKRLSRTSIAASTSVLDVLLHLLQFLLHIIRHNLAMFSASDLATILELHIQLVWDAIKDTGSSARSEGASVGGASGNRHSASTFASSSRGGRDRRSGSAIGKPSVSLSSPNSPSRTAAKDRQDTTPASTRLSRSSSLLKRSGDGGKAGAAQPLTTGGSADSSKPKEDAETGNVFEEREAGLDWERLASALFALADFLLETKTLPPMSVASVIRTGATSIGLGNNIEIERHFGALVARMLKEGLVGRSAERAVRNVLEGKGVPEEDNRWACDMVYGMVIVLRQILDLSGGKPDIAITGQMASTKDALPTLSLTNLSVSLASAMTCERCSGDSASTGLWLKTDFQILLILDDYLDNIELQGKQEKLEKEPEKAVVAVAPVVDRGKARETWMQGDVFCSILRNARVWLADYRLPGGSLVLMSTTGIKQDDHDIPAIVTAFCRVVYRLPEVLGRCYANTKTNHYIHPKYADLMLDLASHLPQEMAVQVIDYYESEGLCMPLSSDWVDNVWKILRAFYIPLASADRGSSVQEATSLVRRRAARLLYDYIWSYVGDFSDYRALFVDAVILPLLEETLPHENDTSIFKSALEVLIAAASLETIERDEERRKTRSGSHGRKPSSDLKALGIEARSSSPRGTFERVRTLMLQVCTTSSCGTSVPSGAGPVDSTRPLDDIAGSPSEENPQKLEQENKPPSEDVKDTQTNSILGFVGSLSPSFNRSKELPSLGAMSTPGSPPNGRESSPSTREGIAISPSPTPSRAHEHCKSHGAALAMIAIFSRLAFSPPLSVLSSSSKAARLPASTLCNAIFKDLLRLLAPTSGYHHATSGTSAPVTTGADNVESFLHAQCPQARLSILQWLMRLRADKQHRIWVKPSLDDAAYNWAKSLSRATPRGEPLPSQEETPVGPSTSTRRRPGRMEPTVSELQKSDRGREGRSASNLATGRSPSRARMAAVAMPPLWAIPDTLDFEYPTDGRPSEGMTTYDPAPKHKTAEGSAVIEGVWLPISEYLRVVAEILTTETDWDLVSYVWVFLPLQLANKHFFCGPRASSGIRNLRSIICNGILDDLLVTKGTVLPSAVRKTDIRAVAYQTLTIMISYRRLFSKADGDAIVDAFSKGLRDHHDTAKPCVQALTIATFELETHLAKRLPAILPVLSQIMSNPALSIHILELLSAIGNVPVLYENFTDEHYRLIFKVALAYIQTHNLTQSSTPDIRRGQRRPPAECGPLTLADQVIGLSYFVIYTWFMVVNLKSRPSYVSELTTQLVLANKDPANIDEMTEVCFDWLARYAYGNADPKPASSFINDLVMDDGIDRSTGKQSGDIEPPESKTWLLGGAFVTISAKPRSGWATITTRRPSGTVSLLCKIENVPLLTVGEDDADLRLAPALMQGDRDEEEMAQAVLGAMPLMSPDALSVSSAPVGTSSITIPKSTLSSASRGGDGTQQLSPTALSPSSSSFAGASSIESRSKYVWSGVAPSQRRKDVAIDPSFIAFQLSAYPYPGMTSPRGTLLKNDAALRSALKGLDDIQVIDYHRIAVLYVGPGQTTEREILGNTNGSPAFLRFLSGMARLVRLKDQKDVFLGGLDSHTDEDGEFTYAWWDDLAQVVYLAPHMMPNPDSDPYLTRKKAHVGNSFVRIVYNDSGADYRFDTIGTQFNYINIVISAHTAGVSGIYDDREEHDFFKVTLQRAPGIPEFSPFGEFKLVSAATLPLLIRQTSLMANLMAQVYVQVELGYENVSNWRQRLGVIKRYISRLPPADLGITETDPAKVQQILRDFTKLLSFPPAT